MGDVTTFTIKWPMARVGDELLQFLEGLPVQVLEEYMERGRRLRCWYVFPPLLHEVETEPESDELYKICPRLRTENAFEGIMRLLDRKRRSSWTAGNFFGPPTAQLLEGS